MSNKNHSQGDALIAAERQRQIMDEGYSHYHDDQHDDNSLVEAAIAYARYGSDPRFAKDPPQGWPWERAWWKPASRVRNLVKAGALIAAEIDRLQRLDEQ